MAKKIIKGAGFSLLRNLEIHKAIQFRSILHLPMNTYKRMQRLMANFGYDKNFSHHIIVLFWSNKKRSHISPRTPF